MASSTSLTSSLVGMFGLIEMESEKAKLSEYHEYEDKQVDQPFLTPDSVLEDNV